MSESTAKTDPKDTCMQRQTKPTILVVGASRATGRLLVELLLQRDATVKAFVRSLDRLPETLVHHPRLSVIQGSLLELSDSELEQLTKDCGSAASIGLTKKVRPVALSQ